METGYSYNTSLPLSNIGSYFVDKMSLVDYHSPILVQCVVKPGQVVVSRS